MKIRGILLGIFSGIILSNFMLMQPVTVGAAACANVSSFGAVIMQVPELVHTQDQSLWVRLQGQSGDRILVEINERECYELKLQDSSTDQWYWQALQDSGETKLINFSQASGNKLKIIGLSSGMRVDRLLIAEPDCVPEDFGNNCRTSVSLDTSEDTNITSLASPPQPISGKAHISPTVQEIAKQLSSLTYTVNGQVLQRESSAQAFDSTLVENGRYTVHITSTKNDGSVIREMVVVDVNNPENALTPAARWIKRHKTSLNVIGSVLLGLTILFVSFKFIFNRRKLRRERTFRGL